MNIRLVARHALALPALCLAFFSFASHAADPASGTLTLTSGPITYTAGPLAPANPTPLPEVDVGPECMDPVQPCDSFALTVQLPDDYATTHPDAVVKVTLEWTDNGTGASDYDLWIFAGDVQNTDGTQGADASSASGANPEVAQILSPAGTKTYTIKVVPYTPTGETLKVTVELATNAPTTEDPCAQSDTATSGGAVLGPGVAADLQALADDALYGAFVHFSMGTPAQHRQVLALHGLAARMSFEHYASAIYARGPAGGFKSLIHEPSVRYLERNKPLRYMADTANWATRARIAQEAVAGGPYFDANGHVLDGTGVTISVVDSGLNASHPDFAGRVIHNYVIEGDDAATTLPPVDVGYTSSDTTGGHGTHCNGIAAGGGEASDGAYPVADVAPFIRGTYTGVAPGATLDAYGVGQAIAVLAADAAFQHILDTYDQVTPRIRVISNSYGDSAGSQYNPGDVTSCLAKALVKRGVVLTYAANNDGGDGTTDMTSSTCKDPTPGVICVANYDDGDTGRLDGPLDTSSSRGKQGEPTTYPDIAAPGAFITATCAQPEPGQGVCATGAETKWQPWYGTISGTSMATPNIAGILALLFEAKPDLTPAQAEKLLQDTARKIGDGYEPDPQNPGGTIHYGYGAGLVDVRAALDALGVTKAGLPAAAIETTIFDGDTDAAIVDSAADVVKLTMQETAAGVTPSGITFRLTVADPAGFNVAGAVTYTVQMNVAGQHYETSVVLSPEGVSIPEGGSGNTAVATTASLDGNVISFFVAYSQLGYPDVDQPIHNIRVVTSDDNGLVEDRAPSPGLNTNTPEAAILGNALEDLFPMYGRPFTILQPAGPKPPSTEQSCVLPGLTMTTSPPGTTALGGASLPTAQDDLRQSWIAEPTDLEGEIVFTIKVDNLSSVPPAYRWLTYFNLPNDDNQYFVGMDSSEGVPPVFNYGTRTTIDLPEAPVGDYQVLGSLNAASHYDADGTITLVLDKSALNIQPGMVLTNIATSIRQSSPSSAGAVGLTVDSAASIGSYTVVGNQCVETGGNTGGNTGGDGGEPPVTGTGGNARFGGAVGATLFLPLLGAAALRRRRSFLDQQALRNT